MKFFMSISFSPFTPHGNPRYY